VDDPPLVIVSTAQQLKSTVREPVMLMLSSFLRVLVVSALVHGVAAAMLLHSAARREPRARALVPHRRTRRLCPAALVIEPPCPAAGRPRRRREPVATYLTSG